MVVVDPCWNHERRQRRRYAFRSCLDNVDPVNGSTPRLTEGGLTYNGGSNGEENAKGDGVLTQ